MGHFIPSDTTGTWKFGLERHGIPGKLFQSVFYGIVHLIATLRQQRGSLRQLGERRREQVKHSGDVGAVFFFSTVRLKPDFVFF